MKKIAISFAILAAAALCFAQAYTPMSAESAATVTGNRTFSGSVTVSGSMEAKGLKVTPATYAATGAIDVTKGMAILNGGTNAVAMTIAAPVQGQFLVITSGNALTNTVTMTAGTFDGTNDKATFDAANETLVLFGLSATRWAIVENIGSVGLATK
jgi:lipopolysaccharide export system protein LptA